MLFCMTSYMAPFTAQQFAATEFYDEPYFEDLISLLFPENYLDSLKSPGPGFEVFQGYAVMGERLSLSATRCYLGALILSAAGANYSTGTVQFSRANDQDSLAMNTGLTYTALVDTVTITNGSPDIVGGVSTNFTVDCPPGTILKFAGGSRPYRVLSVTDDRHLTLTMNIVDPSGAGLAYYIGWTPGYNQQPGTIQIFNGLSIVDGAGTTFKVQVQIGDLISFTGATRPYHVIGITGNTTISIGPNVVEASAIGLNWFLGDGEQLISINPGTVVETSYGGRDYTTNLPITFGIGQLQQNVDVTAVAASYQYNVPGPIAIANGTILPGSVTIIKAPLYTPPYVPTPFTVSQVTDICGGNPPTLDQLGQDRGITRRNGESDTAYRNRVRTLPDTVSPGAIKRLLTQIQTPLGVTFDFIETWEITYQTCWNAPSPNGPRVSSNGGTYPGTPTYQNPSPTNPLYNANLFVYNDPRPAYPPFENRWLGQVDYRGAFIVTVPNLTSVSMLGMAYNDPSSTPGGAPSGLQTTLGKRAVSAYNVPATNFAGELQGAYNGSDSGKQAVYDSLAEQLDQIRAAGVTVEIVLQGT